MEPVGLALGVVGLAGVFKSCIDLFSYFASHRSMGRDYEILDAKLQVEKTLLLQWAQRVRLLEKSYDRRLDDPVTEQAISCILSSIHHLLGESTALQERYGLQSTKKVAIPDTRMAMVSKARMAKLTRDFNTMQLRMSMRQKIVSPSAKLRWIITDKDKFNDLIHELSHFVSRLNDMFRDDEHHQDQGVVKGMTKDDLAAVWDVKVMRLIQAATTDREDTVAEAADERLQEMCEQTVLDLLSFRSMDDRKDNVDPPHPKTFEWALQPPPRDEVEWDDLSQWLQSGSGMYWVSGKAGSGKSTLTKYVSSHQVTADLLQEWAGSSRLSICSFFFWHLGTQEQRSQEGLSRAVLCQLLDAERSLIPPLLPRLWHDATKSSEITPSLPSKSELASAFAKISNGLNLRRRFCFFIDGLDEYVGNHLDGVLFVQRLYKNSDIKVLVSSRPIPICVDAFSREPKLRLEDLTRQDISNYVQDTVGSHPYLERLLESEDTSADILLRQLIDKAAGVFLWVVLACRSVRDGFASYDRIDELQRRVDSLPPELEDLFQHMLEKVDHRYHEQMAKILRICYQRQISSNYRQEEASVYTIALAIFDSYGLNCEDNRPLKTFSASEQRTLCVPMEGRLRSRCGGLLELRRRYNLQNSICFCVSNSHDALVHSTVTFMHRTVFEYLDRARIWDLPSFRITDPSFNANAALSLMSLQLARLLIRGEESPRPFLIDAIHRAQLADYEFHDSAFPILPKLKQIADLLSRPRSRSERDQFMGTEKLVEQEHSSLQMAVESGMVNCTRYYLPKKRSSPLQFPLLYHAIRKPLFWREHRVQSSPDVIRCLLSLGCEPNESFKNQEELTTTPWRDWLREFHRMDTQTVFANIAVCEEFVAGGADICPGDLEPAESIIKRHMNNISSSTAEGRVCLREGEKLLCLIGEKKKRIEDTRMVLDGLETCLDTEPSHQGQPLHLKRAQISGNFEQEDEQTKIKKTRIE
ncbi:hypothetical protein ACHAPJ_006062 [Fusarium lateritium]